MTKHVRQLLCFLIKGLSITLLVTLSSNANQLPIQVVTEELKPLQIDNGDKPPTGAAVDIVKLVLEDNNIDSEIKVYPWARAYLMASTTPNVLIFSMMRTESRENKFHWIGSIYGEAVHLIKLKDRAELQIAHINDAKKYRVGVNRSDISQDYLKSKGFVEDKNIFANSSYARLWELLFQEKVDFILANEFMWLEREKSKDSTYRTLEIALPLPDFATDYYFAASLDTDPKIIIKLKKSLEKIKQSGQYQAILKKWHLAK